MIRLTLDASTQERVTFIPVRDYYNDRRWCAAVTALVAKQLATQACVALVGFEKDASSYHANLFPDWQYVALPKFGEINATSIRHNLYDSHHEVATSALLYEQMPEGVVEYLRTGCTNRIRAVKRRTTLARGKSAHLGVMNPFRLPMQLSPSLGMYCWSNEKTCPAKDSWRFPADFWSFGNGYCNAPSVNYTKKQGWLSPLRYGGCITGSCCI